MFLPMLATPAVARSLVVPTGFATVQRAVDAARPGDRIQLLPGTYREQVSIDKSLSIVGAGTHATMIRAPETLVPGEDGKGSIVEIRNGASASISRLAVSGPGAGGCEDSPLEAGIRVVSGGHLDLRSARVIHIRNSPMIACGHSGVGVLIGVIGDLGSGTAVVRDSQISDYATKGILILSAGPATITGNTITGSPRLAADGVDALLSASTVSRNVISGNICPPSDTRCGPDFFNAVQHAAIFAGGHAGTVVSDNVLFGNQVGIYAFGGQVSPDRNQMFDNELSGMVLQDGDYIATSDRIFGGMNGVTVVAITANATGELANVLIAGTSGDDVPMLRVHRKTVSWATATQHPTLA